MNTMNSDNVPVPQRLQDLLLKSGCAPADGFQERLSQYLSLVREWNRYASLVSKGDLSSLEESHLVDALSLAPVIVRLGQDKGLLLDIGSGGGFPAIPLKTVLPDLRIVMIERSGRKVAFLRKASAVLGFENTVIVEGSFPESAEAFRPSLVTGRAVEAPDRLLHQVLSFLPEGASFLCQVPADKLQIPEMFHVEHVKDEWTTKGLRRGTLSIITHAPACQDRSDASR